MSVILGGIEIRKRTKLIGLQVYLASLRWNNPEARVVIFNRSPENEELSSLLRQYEVTEINAKEFDIKYSIPQVEIEIARFLQYFAWLQTNIVDNVILTDLLDIVWQHNPFRILPKEGLKVFEENNFIGSCPYNSKWMREVWNNDYIEYFNKPIICCGVIAGTEHAVYDYLKRYYEEFKKRDNVRRGFDSAIINAYARSNRDVDVEPFINSDCMHLGYAVPERVNRTYVVLYDSIVPKVVHQYNRHPSIMKEVYEQWT